MFRKKITLAITLAILIALATVSIALAEITFIIDHFDTFQQINLTWPGTPMLASGLADPEVLGGERDIVGNINIAQGGETLLITSNNASNSLLTIATGNHVASWSELQYDGDEDVNKADIDYTGLYPDRINFPLDGFDLESFGDRFVVSIVFDDVPADIVMSAYTDIDNWSAYTETLPGGISIAAPYIMEIPFTSFTQKGTGEVDFADLGALTLRVDATDLGTSLGMDLTLHFLSVANGSYLDFDDLPDSYHTLLTTGARNLVSLDSVLLGPSVTFEPDGLPSANADGDVDNGVVRTPSVHWIQGVGGGSVDITVSQCPLPAICYVSAWIDWNQDGDFGTGPAWDGEIIMRDQPVSDGTTTVTFDIPVDPSNGQFYARFRIYENPLGSFVWAHNAMLTGETEGFLWEFGPTAIELVSVEANTNYAVPFALLAGALILLVSGGAILVFKRRRV